MPVQYVPYIPIPLPLVTGLMFAVAQALRYSSVADPDPGSGAFLTPRSGMDKKSGSGIRNEQPGSYFLELRNHVLGLKCFIFDADLVSGMKKIRIGDPDKHPRSATLHYTHRAFILGHFPLYRFTVLCIGQ